jgi:hypothetical protein
VGLVVFISCTVAVEYSKFDQIEKQGPNSCSPVAATFPRDAKSVEVTIQSIFNEWASFSRSIGSGTFKNKFRYEDKWSHFLVFRNGDSASAGVSTDGEILANKGVDRFIPRYFSIRPDGRSNDSYLHEPSGDYYRQSEYYYGQRPAKFRCAFIIHLEPEGDSRTLVEIFESPPAIWVGEKFGFSTHGITPRAFHDIRFVEPTTADRLGRPSMIQDTVAKDPAT